MRKVHVTPEIAREWLEKNTSNRGVSKAHVSDLAGHMSRGEWIAAASDPLRFALDGTLLDGQHRLLAIIDAGISIDMWIVEGLPRDAFTILGQQRPRHRGDVLAAIQVPCAHTVAAALGWAWIVDRGGNDSKRPTHQQIAQMAWGLPGIGDALHGLNRDVRKLWQGSIAVYLNWVTAGLAEQFLNSTATAVGLGAGDARLAMHRILVDQKTSRAKRPGRDMLALSIKAYIAYAKDRQLMLLKFRPKTETTPEVFPKLTRDIAPRIGLTLPYSDVLPKSERPQAA